MKDFKEAIGKMLGTQVFDEQLEKLFNKGSRKDVILCLAVIVVTAIILTSIFEFGNPMREGQRFLVGKSVPCACERSTCAFKAF